MKHYAIQTNMTLGVAVVPRTRRAKVKPLPRLPVVGKPADNIIQWAALKQPLLLLEWLAK